MIKSPTFDLDISFGFNVTGRATPYGTRDTLLLPSRPCLVKMTDKTVSLMNGEVQALNELSMAGGASKSHPPSQLTQMFPMGKVYILKYHIPLKIFTLMTPFL